LFQPFVKMTARAKGLISEDLATQLQKEQETGSGHVTV
jgi:hypothetical protein